MKDFVKDFGAMLKMEDKSSAHIAIGSSVELHIPSGYKVTNCVWFRGTEPMQQRRPVYQIVCVGVDSFARYTLLFTDERGRKFCQVYELIPRREDVLGNAVNVPIALTNYKDPHDAFFTAYRVYDLHTSL